jgi:DNA-binding XRE family transcriptional regulator
MSTDKLFDESTDFQTHLDEELKDPVFRQYFDEFGKQLEIAYELLQLRKQQGISQAELAMKLGTSQGNVARIESGNQNFTVKMLGKLAKVYGRQLKIEFVK